MFISHEEAGAVGTNRFIDAISIKESMIEDGDHGIVFLHELIIQVDPHFVMKTR
jgi:hypothetical protein